MNLYQAPTTVRLTVNFSNVDDGTPVDPNVDTRGIGAIAGRGTGAVVVTSAVARFRAV
jgi:hypothetical protein